jgi:osomolarity two-component system phosphorelay intermediate protein YPD1
MVDFGDHVDEPTFIQILEMDEEQYDVSMPLVINFFEQADETLENMNKAVAAKDLSELSKLGHFLRGSSSTLGFTKIKDNCQIILQYGIKSNVDGTAEPDEEICLKKITDTLSAVKIDMDELKKMMNKFFGIESK